METTVTMRIKELQITPLEKGFEIELNNDDYGLHSITLAPDNKDLFADVADDFLSFIYDEIKKEENK